jgi:putative ABC transport system substrate-binding protein
MKRREFITLLGGIAAAPIIWPYSARAQQAERMRRVGVLMGFAESDQDWQARITGLRAALQQLGWIDGHNLRLDVRWAESNPDRARAIAGELVGKCQTPFSPALTSQSPPCSGRRAPCRSWRSRPAI